MKTTTVQCSAPSQIGYDTHILVGFDQNKNAIVNEGSDWESNRSFALELKIYVPCEHKTSSYGFMLKGIWYEFARSINN